eukprot:scaffold155_cov347-Pavlova_lutheri.AAC.77
MFSGASCGFSCASTTSPSEEDEWEPPPRPERTRMASVASCRVWDDWFLLARLDHRWEGNPPSDPIPYGPHGPH